MKKRQKIQGEKYNDDFSMTREYFTCFGWISLLFSLLLFQFQISYICCIQHIEKFTTCFRDDVSEIKYSSEPSSAFCKMSWRFRRFWNEKARNIYIIILLFIYFCFRREENWIFGQNVYHCHNQVHHWILASAFICTTLSFLNCVCNS